MSLQPYIEEIRNKNPKWKNNSRIIGRACEIYYYRNSICMSCNSSNWFECKINEKSKDQICNICKKKYQIKCKKINNKKYKKILDTGKFKTIGAEYNTTLKSICENIDYIIILYNESYKILDILHISCENISHTNIIPRKPLSNKAKRKGWQGCYLEFFNFKSILSIN